MFDYKKWLQPKLEKNSGSEKTATAISAISAIPSDTNSNNSENSGSNLMLPKKPNIAEIREFLGEDWFLYSNNPKAINCWMDLIVERRMIENGVIPPDYTGITHCKCCGDVFVPTVLVNSGHVLGCPWCSNNVLP